MVSLLGAHSLVDRESGTLAEDLATPTAPIGLLPCVHSLVDTKAGALTEGLPTLITFIGLLSSVDSDACRDWRYA